MLQNQFLINGPETAKTTLILAHGAGAPMDSEFMAFFANALAELQIRVIRFEFPYMVQRRQNGSKRPPNPQKTLLESWRQVIAATGPASGIFIGGKSMGGRMASMIAAEMKIAGLVCLGYPFHPPGKPERLRTNHLADLKCPALFVQGTRDTFGGQTEVSQYHLPGCIRFHWAEDGDHSLKPRKRSGTTQMANWQKAVEAIHAFLVENSRTAS